MPTVLVTGFGPFLDVDNNPSGLLARQVDGRRVGPWRVVGLELPVSTARAPALTLMAAHEHGAAAIVGLGLAQRRDRVCVEAMAWPDLDPSLRDIDGVAGARLPGPASIEARFPCATVAVPLAAVVSRDPGRYVCDAWLYTVCRDGPPGVAVGFVHIPATGLCVERLLLALAVLPLPPSPKEIAHARGRPAPA
jgi:pyroglutamyl-peptidase